MTVHSNKLIHVAAAAMAITYIDKPFEDLPFCSGIVGPIITKINCQLLCVYTFYHSLWLVLVGGPKINAFNKSVVLRIIFQCTFYTCTDGHCGCHLSCTDRNHVGCCAYISRNYSGCFAYISKNHIGYIRRNHRIYTFL